MKRDSARRVRWALLALGFVGIVALAARNRMAGGPLEALAVYGEVPAFSLSGIDGRSVTKESLLGRPWIVDFIFTRCAGTCPAMSSSMSRLQSEFADVPALRFVSVTVDPEYDTPEVLGGYAEGVAADPERWFFATGEKSAIYRLSKEGFHLGAADPADDAAAVAAGSDPPPGAPGADDVYTEEIMHSTRFVLVDAQAQIRGYYDGLDPSAMAALARDARILARSGP